MLQHKAGTQQQRGSYCTLPIDELTPSAPVARGLLQCSAWAFDLANEAAFACLLQLDDYAHSQVPVAGKRPVADHDRAAVASACALVAGVKAALHKAAAEQLAEGWLFMVSPTRKLSTSREVSIWPLYA